MATMIPAAVAIVAALNDPARAWGEPFEAERRYDPELDVTELERLRVTVHAIGRTRETLNRGHDTLKPVVDIGIRERTGNDEARNDQLLRLTEAIDEYFATLPTVAVGVRVNKSEIPLAYSVEYLRTKGGVFLGVVRVTLQLHPLVR